MKSDFLGYFIKIYYSVHLWLTVCPHCSVRFLTILFFKKATLFIFKGWLLYNIVLVSAIHQYESAIGLHMSPPARTSLPTTTHPTPLGHHRAPVWDPCIIQPIPTAHILYMVTYTFPYYSIHLSHPLLSTLCPQVCSPRSCCPANKFISTIFLDSIYKHEYKINFFLFLTNFSLYNRL